jgi:hypothetical protein
MYTLNKTTKLLQQLTEKVQNFRNFNYINQIIVLYLN